MSIEAAARQARDVFGEVLDTLRREAPGTPLNNHRFDGLGIRAYAAIAALDAVLAATPKPLDDPRLQGLFSDAISGALAFGAQNTNPPPAGHWLERFWQMGRAERALSEAAPPAAVRDLLIDCRRELAAAQEDARPLAGKYGNVMTPFVRLMEAELHANASKATGLVGCRCRRPLRCWKSTGTPRSCRRPSRTTTRH
jgi:hypothetical protein